VTLAPDLSAAVVRAGVDPTLEWCNFQDALKRAIADRREYVHYELNQWGWCVDLLRPVRDEVRARTLEAALARCLVFLMADKYFRF
jgi:hypothetical protein